MRIRYSVGSALGAFCLVVTLPTSAQSAIGTFTYLDGALASLPDGNA